MYFTTPLFLLLLRTATAAPVASSSDIPYLPCPEDHPMGNFGPVCEPRAGAKPNPNEPLDPRLGGSRITPYHPPSDDVVARDETDKTPADMPTSANPDGSAMVGSKDDTPPAPFPCPSDWPSDFGIGPVCTPEKPKVTPPPCPEGQWPVNFGIGPVCTPNKPTDGEAKPEN